MTERPLTLALSGYYGFDNAGDEAVLAGIVEAVRARESGVRLIALSANPRRTSAEHGIEAVSRMSPREVMGTFRDSDLLISGGGSLFQDVTSFRSVLYYAAIIRLAGVCGLQSFMYAQGVGPLNGDGARRITAGLRAHLAGVTVRDDESAKLLVSLGYDPQAVQVTADPVFGLSPLPTTEVLPLMGREGIAIQGPTIAVCLRRTPHDAAVLREAKGLVDYLIREKGFRVVLVPFHHPEDIRMCDELMEYCGCEGVHVLRHAYSPRQLMTIMGLFDAVIGMRLHSLIFAARMGVPCLGLSYDPKVASFCSSIGAKCIELAAMPRDLLIGAFSKVMAQRREIVDGLERANPRLRQEALRTADAALAIARQHHERKERSR